jgi:hypothetical protein
LNKKKENLHEKKKVDINRKLKDRKFSLDEIKNIP